MGSSVVREQALQPRKVLCAIVDLVKSFSDALILQIYVKWVKTVQLVVWEGLKLFQASLASALLTEKGVGNV